MRGGLILLAFGLAIAACTSPRPGSRVVAPLALQTRAERTDFRETSRYADVMRSLRQSDSLSSDIHLTTFGESGEGRALPLAVWNAPGAGPEAVRSAGTTRVLIVGNIHGGEVAGKEAALLLLRDLALGWGRYNVEPGRPVPLLFPALSLDNLTLLIAPLYNADGNEAIAYDNRPLQLGPVGGMGQRPNAAGLDLNRDLMKAAAPETRALLGLFDAYDPHVVLDLHTTDGTAMDYGLTYAPGLSPNTPAGLDALLRDEWLPAVSAGLLANYDLPTTHYGNVPGAFGEPATAPRGWYSFSADPRFLTNYVGLRGRIGILSEAYSYSPFEQRVVDTRRFVDAVLARAAGDAERVRALTDAADADRPAELALRAEFDALGPVEIWLSRVDTVAHPVTGAPMRRDTGERIRESMPAFVRFAASTSEPVPAAYYVERTDAVQAVLDAHGIVTTLDALWGVARQRFAVDSVSVAARPFQGVRMQTAHGRWVEVEPESGPPPRLAARIRVDMDQPLARVAFMLLEPTSPDGLVAWGVLAESGGALGIERVPAQR